ncbi:MAG: cell wall metabolism sensor histidine kinase WalK, partial [Clostridiales bacterium]|nr:cell wall metabolism sensor histidine kinase WalK [Clostridiales bacterium]
DQLERIFERFYRADQARSSEGFGLGLSIADQIAQEHGGRLWAESSLDSGNTFLFSMPRLREGKQ